VQSDVEQREGRGKNSQVLPATHCYLTCLIKESSVPFCSQIQIPNSSFNQRQLKDIVGCVQVHGWVLGLAPSTSPGWYVVSCVPYIVPRNILPCEVRCEA
jgi:hypothetical protein